MARKKLPARYQPYPNPLAESLRVAKEGRVLAAASAEKARRYAELAAASGPVEPEA